MTHAGTIDMTRTKTTTTTIKANAKTRVFPCVLKTIIDDAMREKTIASDDAKKIRAKLRVAFRDTHLKNTSWVAMSQRDYDALRCAFDAQYATRIANAKKRVAKTRVAPIVDDANAQ